MDGKVILIAGPTASGKSRFALALAERVGGLVINADSMQVYRELRVLTARPSDEDLARAVHALYGHVPGAEAYSAGRFAQDAAHAIADARSRGFVPIVAGGTGLYFKALLEGLSPIPAIPGDVRRHWRAEASRIGAEALHGELARRDPVMAAQLRPSDPQRVTRALEVLEATGRSLGHWQMQPGRPVVAGADAVKTVVVAEREALFQRVDARFIQMMEGGAREEVRSLMALGLDPGLPVMRALGVRALMQLERGEVGLDEAVAAAQAETRQYARRQLTWLRRNMSAWMTIDTQQMENELGRIVSFIDRKA